MEYKYSVPEKWYEGLFKDEEKCVKAARSFSLLHEEKPKKAVLLIHGYTGYPGELVRPARDLFEEGFDVYCPRLPGHGTSSKDFIKTGKKDWIGLALNAAEDLVNQFEDLYILGHSMGGAIAAIVTEKVKGVKKAIFAAPAIVKGKKDLPAKPGIIKLVSLFKKELPTKWSSDSEYIMYYEDAPNDDPILGERYWSHLFPKQLYELFTLMLDSGIAVKNIDVPTLTIVSKNDKLLGLKPAEYVTEINKKASSFTLDNATHYLFYDKDKKEEEKAVKEVIEFLKN